jgi:hypothetical protein
VAELKRQLDKLTAFEIFAVAQLIQKGGMSGQHFYSTVVELGFPVESRAHQQHITSNTFTDIEAKVTFLTRDYVTGYWAVKSEFGDELQYLIGLLTPVFGV